MSFPNKIHPLFTLRRSKLVAVDLSAADQVMDLLDMETVAELTTIDSIAVRSDNTRAGIRAKVFACTTVPACCPPG